MNVQKHCLIPKKIVNDIINKNSDETDNSNPLNSAPVVINKKQSIFSEKILPDLNEEISSLFTSPIKIKKAKNIYLWIKNNSPEIEISSNGNLIKPLDGINILTFLKDILSQIKTFPRDKLEKYRIFIALINIPKEFLENQIIRNFIYLDEKIDNKRKLSSEIDSEDTENTQDEDASSPQTIKKFRSFVKKVKRGQSEIFPRETRQSKKKLNLENIGSGYNKKLKQKWINY